MIIYDILYGTNAIINISKINPEIIQQIYIFKKNYKINNLIKNHKIKYITNINNKKFDYIIKTFPVISKIKKTKEQNIGELIKNKKNQIILILDRIQDPHNLASCIRTAEAFNVNIIIISKKHSAKISPLINKISHGCGLITSIIKNINIKNAIKIIKSYDIPIIGMSALGKNNITYDKIKKPIAIIMGSEKDGIKKTIQQNCNTLYKIPMTGKCHNINVSVATGIVLSHIQN